MFNLHTSAYGHYDNAKAMRSYLRYRASPTDDHLVDSITSLIPIAGMVLRGHFHSLTREDEEDLCSFAAIELMDLVRRGRIDPSRGMYRYVRKALKNSMVDSVKKSKVGSEIIDFKQAPVSAAFLPQARSSIAGVEAKIFLEQAKKTVFEDARNRIRLVGMDRQACLFVLDSLEKKKPYTERVVRARFGSDPKLVAGHCTFLLRQAMYRFRDNNGFLVANMEEFLGLEDYDGGEE